MSRLILPQPLTPTEERAKEIIKAALGKYYELVKPADIDPEAHPDIDLLGMPEMVLAAEALTVYTHQMGHNSHRQARIALMVAMEERQAEREDQE